jgi:Reverse transcriptase (RNA-dependent DNA polymerase)
VGNYYHWIWSNEWKKVWTITPRSKIPSNRKVIGNQWVFDQKDDERFQAQTVAKGFTQIPGKDFPAVNDTTFHTILVLKILLGLDAGQFDIETAFLYGNLEE